MVIIILCFVFFAVLIYTIYLYLLKVFIEWVRYIDWLILRIMFYILIALYVIIPHATVLSLLIALI